MNKQINTLTVLSHKGKQLLAKSYEITVLRYRFSLQFVTRIHKLNSQFSHFWCVFKQKVPTSLSTDRALCSRCDADHTVASTVSTSSTKWLFMVNFFHSLPSLRYIRKNMSESCQIIFYLCTRRNTLQTIKKKVSIDLPLRAAIPMIKQLFNQLLAGTQKLHWKFAICEFISFDSLCLIKNVRITEILEICTVNVFSILRNLTTNLDDFSI